MPLYNFHQHSSFSDGQAHAEQYVEKASQLNFKAMGFTEHSPLPFKTTFSLKMENIDDYIKTIEILKDKYSGKISVYRALEMDYIPRYSEDFSFWRKIVKADYLIGSVHLVKSDVSNALWFIDGPNSDVYDKGIKTVFNGNIKKAVSQFFIQSMLMIESQKFEVIGHFDKIKMHNKNRFFNENEAWYIKLVDNLLDLIKQKGIIVEINTRGIYKKRSHALFPDGVALQKVKKFKIPIIISSDAHKPDEINASFDIAVNRLLNMGFKDILYFNNGEWQECKLQ